MNCLNSADGNKYEDSGNVGSLYPRQHRFLLQAAGISLLCLIASIIVLSLVPPISRDALIHHLAIPKLYLKHGQIYEIPSMIFSYFPMNIDLLYLIPLYFENDIAPKFIHFGFALLTAWLVFRYLNRRLNRLYGLTGALFFLSIPIIIKLSITVYVDLGLVFFCTSSILLLFEWKESRFRKRYLVASAVCCGLALGTKYNGLLSFLVLSSFVPFIYSKCAGDQKSAFLKPALQGGIFILVSLLVFSPWMIRNWHWTKNPIYPMYGEVFQKLRSIAEMKDLKINPDSKQIQPQKTEARNSEKNWQPGVFGLRHHLYGESLGQILCLPLRIFFQGQDGKPQYFDGKLNPFLFFLPFFAFYRRRQGDESLIRTEKKILAFFSILFFAFALFSTGLRTRYILPIIPPLVILSVFGTRNLFETAKSFRNTALSKVSQFIVMALVISYLGLNLHYLIGQFAYVKPFEYLMGNLSRDEYIEKYRFEYPAMKYINENLPEDSLIYFLFMGKRGYYCDREYIPDNADNMKEVVKSAGNPLTVYKYFKKKGVTHLLVQMYFFEQFVTSVFSAQEIELLNEFFRNHLVPEFIRNDVVLYRLTVAGTG